MRAAHHPAEVRAILRDRPGREGRRRREKNYMPMPKDATGQGDVLCGRIRTDLSDPSGKSFLHVRRGRPAAEGRGPQRGANRGVAAKIESEVPMRLTAVYQQVPEGYIGFVEELPGANTQAGTPDKGGDRWPRPWNWCWMPIARCRGRGHKGPNDYP